MIRFLVTLSAITSSILLVGCGGERDIKTYRIAKEETGSHPGLAGKEDTNAGHNHGDEMEAAPAPQVHWELPAGWKEQKPDRMRVASFQITSDDGRMAEVVVIPLPQGNDIENQAVNFWRQEVGLEPLNATDLEQQRQKVEAGTAGSGNLYEMSGAAPKGSDKLKSRVIGVVAPHDEMLWFIKMRGEDSLVSEQKPNFLKFVKSLHFSAPAPQLALAEKPVSTNSKKIPASADLPKWKVPQNWLEKTPGPMLLASYHIAEQGAEADVTISKFPGEAGGQAANISRWRNQLGLPPAGEGDSSASSVEIGGKTAYVVDIKGTNARTGKPARMVALGVPRTDETWFYKLLGDEAVVEKEKNAFIQFVKSAY